MGGEDREPQQPSIQAYDGRNCICLIMGKVLTTLVYSPFDHEV